MIQLIKSPLDEFLSHSFPPSHASLKNSLFNTSQPENALISSFRSRVLENEVEEKVLLSPVDGRPKLNMKSGSKNEKEKESEQAEGPGAPENMGSPVSVSTTLHTGESSSTSLESPLNNANTSFFAPEDEDLSVREVCRNFFEFIKEVGFRKVLWAFILSLFVISGQVTQLIFLNYWLREYPKHKPPGNYTTFFISSFVFSIFFISWLVLYFIIKRPKSLRFMKDPRGLLLLFGIGTMDTVNSVLAIYSADRANEVLEATFNSVLPPLTAAVSRIFLNERRTVLNVWFILSILLVVGGVFLASGYMFHDSNGFSENTSLWTLIFFISVPPNVFLNVWQARYIILFTKDRDFEKKVITLHVLQEKGELQVKTVPSEDSEEKKTNEEEKLRVTSVAHTRSSLSIVPSALSSFLKVREKDDDMGHHKERSNDQQVKKSADSESQGMTLCHSPQTSPPITLSHPSGFSIFDTEPHHELTHDSIPNVRPYTPSVSPLSESSHTSSFMSVREGVEKKSPEATDFTSAYRVHYPDMQQSNDTLVKLWMLVVGTTVQFLQTVALLPADAIPWWGGSATVSDAAANLGTGLETFFTNGNNFLFGVLYSAGFILTYIGSAYLNHYSVTLCSMVTEISSPLTALLLVMIPAINLSGTPVPVGYSISAVITLLMGTILYTLWDYTTKAQKEYNEFRLKKRNVKTEVISVRHAPAGEECSLSHFALFEDSLSPTSLTSAEVS